MVRPMVHSTKHYVQFPIDDIAAGVVQNNIVASAVNVVDKNLTSEVEEGSTIKAVYFEMWMLSSSNDSEFILTVSKNPEFGLGPTFVEMASLGTYSNKKNVFYLTQGLSQNDGVTGAVAVMRSWLKIPKSKQRFGLGDLLSLSISNVSAGTLQRCGFATYKEYS